MEAASQAPQILQSYRKKQGHRTVIPACVALILWHAEETDADSLWPSIKKERRKGTYSVEPELHNGCIVEFIDFSAQGDEPVSALNFFFILLPGGLPVVSSQHCLWWKRTHSITAGFWRAGSSTCSFYRWESVFTELESFVQGPQRVGDCAFSRCAFALHIESVYPLPGMEVLKDISWLFSSLPPWNLWKMRCWKIPKVLRGRKSITWKDQEPLIPPNPFFRFIMRQAGLGSLLKLMTLKSRVP